jgi:hypothetical protein
VIWASGGIEARRLSSRGSPETGFAFSSFLHYCFNSRH